MNKKFLSAISLVLALCAAPTLTSCLEDVDEGENEALFQGYFTTDGTASSIILHQDGGGTVYPDVSTIKNPADFLKNERYLLQFKYKQKNISEDGNSINSAELYGGEVIPVSNPMTLALASDSIRQVMSTDSLFSMRKLTGVWAYRGYLNVIINGDYSYVVKNGETVYIRPTITAVFDPEKLQEPDRLDLTLCYNRHTDNSAYTATAYDFMTSFRLGQFAALVPGNDSIRITLSGLGLKDQTIKVGRQDLQKGNYK